MSTDEPHQRPHGDILIVDDSRFDLKLLSEILTKAGYRVRPADDGELALRSVQAKLPDLILLDFNLPGMDGIEICYRLKADPKTKDIPVIFISALGKTDLKVKALDTGAVDYITKPIEPPEVLARIDTHLNMYRLQRKLANKTEKLKTEIEERKRAEEELKESEHRLVRAQEIGHVGDWEYDVETDSAIWSDELYHIYGIDHSTKLDSKTAIAKTYPDDRDYVNKTFASCIETGRGETFECRIVRPDGSIRHVYSPAEVICDGNGKVVKVFGVTHDITERKESEEKLKEYAEGLERSNELKVLFADIMRHDLLNPAGIVQGYTEMLFDMEDDEKKIDFLQKIDENNKKLINLIETTARFAKLESVEELEFGEKDISSMFKIVVDNLRPQIKNKQITLEFKAEGTYSANVSPMIEEVFVNLLSNAIKYSPEKSKVIVDIIDMGENWKIAVTDFGEGVLDEHKTMLFDRFQRVNKIAVKGSGLGLAIVKRIIELHGGDVGVEDNPDGVGSVFWVTVRKA